jgi:hypothetical protein
MPGKGDGIGVTPGNQELPLQSECPKHIVMNVHDSLPGFEKAACKRPLVSRHNLCSPSKSQEGQNSSIDSGRIDSLVHFAMLLQPINVTAAGAFLNLADELDRLRLKARLGRIVHWEHHLNFDGNDITVSMNPPNTTDAFSRYSHG